MKRAEESPQAFPWPSAVSLLYPIAATLYAASTPSTLLMIAGYGLCNLGYLLCAAGLLRGTFRIFGLTQRWQVLTLAATSFVLGMMLSNLDQ